MRTPMDETLHRWVFDRIDSLIDYLKRNLSEEDFMQALEDIIDRAQVATDVAKADARTEQR